MCAVEFVGSEAGPLLGGSLIRSSGPLLLRRFGQFAVERVCHALQADAGVSGALLAASLALAVHVDGDRGCWHRVYFHRERKKLRGSDLNRPTSRV